MGMNTLFFNDNAMKKIILFVFALIAVSCNKELQPQNTASTFDGIFYASIEQNNAAKVEINDLKINWVEGDAISVFDANGTNYKFIADNIEGNKCRFTQSEDTPGKLSGSEFYAIYPYKEGNSISEDKITTNIQSAHTVSSPGLTSANGNVMTAKTSGNTLNFKNACGLMKLSISEDVAVSSLNIILPDGTFGNVTFSIASDGTPSVSTKGTVTNLDITASKGTLKAGTYFIPVVPNTFTGFRMIVNYNGGTVTKSDAFSSKTLTVTRNKVVSLGALYDGRPFYKWLTFEDGQIPSEFTGYDSNASLEVADNPLKTGNTSNKVLKETLNTKGSGYITYSLSKINSSTLGRIKGVKFEIFTNGKKMYPRGRLNAASAKEILPYSVNGVTAPDGGWTQAAFNAAYNLSGWNVLEYRAEQGGQSSFSGWTAMSLRPCLYWSNSNWDSVPVTIYIDNIGFTYE